MLSYLDGSDVSQVIEIELGEMMLALKSQLASLTIPCHSTLSVQSDPSHSTTMSVKVTAPSDG